VIVLAGSIRLAPENLAATRPAMAAMVAASRAEPVVSNTAMRRTFSIPA